MKNWKTTFFGCLGAIGVYLINNTNPVTHFTGVVVSALSTILLGYHATDNK